MQITLSYKVLLAIYTINPMNKRKYIVPNNLKEFRLKAGLTQKQVAEKIGVNNQERISHWEKGRNIPNLHNLVKLCKLYKVNISVVYPELLT